MIELYNLKRTTNFKKKMRIGRGNGSKGTYCGRGCKGSKSRSGYKRKFGYEGGQMPLHRRVPKRGFTNIFKEKYNIINVDVLDKYFSDGDVVNHKVLLEKGLINKKSYKLKILGRGKLEKNLEVTADKISKSAVEKIKSAGGTINN